MTVATSLRSLCTALALAAVALAAPACRPTFYIAQQAANGDAGAQFEYGRRLLMGQRAEKDAQRAQVWFHAAASLRHTKAMLAIGFSHEHGLGVPVDPGKAEEWYRKAAHAGDGDALFSLAGLYMRTGRREKALAELDTLSKLRNSKATKLLIRRYFRQDSPDYTPAKGVDYLRYAAMDGSKEAAAMLAYCYAHGLGVPKNPLLAKGWKAWSPQ